MVVVVRPRSVAALGMSSIPVVVVSGTRMAPCCSCCWPLGGGRGYRLGCGDRRSWTCGWAWRLRYAALLPQLLCRVFQATRVAFHSLEGVESHTRDIGAGGPICGGLAMVLEQQAEVVVPCNVEHLPQALVYEQVLAPEAISSALLLEVLHATRRARRPGRHGIAGEDLQRPMQAKLAIVQVGALLGLWMQRKDLEKPRGEKDGIGVDLHCPIMMLEASLLDDLGPDSDEDVQVQGGPKLASLSALEVTVDDGCVDPWRHLNHLVAVNCKLIAREETHLLLVLHGQQRLLITTWQHEGEAIEGSWRILLQRGLIAVDPEVPLLIQLGHIAGLYVQHARVNFPLAGIQASSAPALDDTSGLIIHPLLTPVACVAWVHVKIDVGLVPVDSAEA
mmetsp:Transcript_67725/g.218816  ORF Transcript_67725/g.218816 Transcript_67725/m.218816 type:complete len:391 (-) Transcript_67725:842-2014(-)